MGQKHDNRIRSGGKHFTYEQRVRMDTLIRMKWPHGKKINFAELGRLMGKARTTVRREYARGEVANKDTEERWFHMYSAEAGRQNANARGQDKGPRMKLTNRIAARFEALVTEEFLSPYAARAVMASEDFEYLPCVRSLYYAVASGMLHITRKSLPYRRDGQKRAPQEGRRMSYKNRDGKSITQRPPEAENRCEYGHWEMDTVIGCMGGSSYCLLVLTERTTRRQIIVRLTSRTQKSVVRALNSLERRADNIFRHMRSLTCDNGCEFLDTRAIERSSVAGGERRTCLYFAHPYSAFERGSNENANRIIRRFIPKGSDIGDYTPRQIKEIEDWMNRLHRESLKGRTATEAEREELNKLTA
ncbi:MAG: IS30 family transposase [Deltaproteobacteria bacterium]